MKLKLMLFTVAVAFTACGTDAVESTTSNSNGTACAASGAACSLDTDCPANEECEDGACKSHGGDCTEDDGDDEQGGECALDADCASGQECEDGFCKPHDSTEDQQGTDCVADTDCGGGEECEDGFCKPHGGD